MDDQTLLSRARDAHRARRYRRAVELANVGLNAKTSPEIGAGFALVRAQALLELGDVPGAERDCRSALGAGGANAQLLLARCCLALERPQEARVAVELALESGVEGAEVWQLAARALGSLGEHAAAVAAAHNAHSREPSRATLLTLSEALRASGRHEERVLLLEQALSIADEDAELWTGLGLSLYSLGREAAAVTALERALVLAPESVDAHCGLAWALLRVGRYADGFRHQEYRQANAGLAWRLGIPPLRNPVGKGASVLVCSEQGFGDTLQFARYLPRLRQSGARTTLLVARPLVQLLARDSRLGTVDAHQPRFGSADYQTLLMSLPHVLKLDDDLAANELPLLTPEPERLAKWRARLPPGPKVALAWQGNPKYGGEPFRSMPFRHFEPLLARFGERVTFVSIQKHVGRDQLRASTCRSRVVDLGDEIDQEHAFVDSLAIMALVDRFVGTDSALAHVAGSGNIPGWILLSNVADWRWGVAPERTAWYPMLRLFRQLKAGDWDEVVAKVGSVLEQELAHGSAGRRRLPLGVEVL